MDIEQIEQGGGNIQVPSFCEEDKGFQSKQFFLTYHLNEHESFEQTFKSIELNLIPLCKQYIFGEEYGKSGETRHIQGAFILYEKQRAKWIDKHVFEHGSTLRKLKNWNQALKYCQKECHKVLCSEIIKPPKKFLSMDQLNAWELKIDNICRTETPDDRHIYWFWSKEGGVGKTSFCKYLHTTYDVCIIGGKASDSKHCVATYIDKSKDNRAPNIVICNIPRSLDMDAHLSYEGIEAIKDMFFFSGKYEGCQVNDNSPHVFVFGNSPPDRKKCSKDRWRLYEIIDKEGNYKSHT